MSRRAGLDQEAVIQAASALIDTEGPDQLSLARLAAQLNIRTPSLYNHIAGLDALRRELALRGLRELNERLRWAALGKNGDAGVSAIAETYREFAREHPGLYAVSVIRAHDPSDAELQAASAETVRIVVAMLAPYGLDGDEAIHAVRALRSLLHGFVSLENGSGFAMPLDIDTSFRYLIEMFIAGLHGATQASRSAAREATHNDNA